MIILRSKSFSDYKTIDDINRRFPDDGDDLSEKDREELTRIKESSDDPNVIDAVSRKLRGSLPNPKNTKRSQVITIGLQKKN